MPKNNRKRDDEFGGMDFDFDFGDELGGESDAPKVRADVEGKQEVSEALRKFKEAAKQEKATWAENTDASYYCVLVFQTGDQKREFFEKAGMKSVMKDDEMYIDGMELATAMKIKLTNGVPAMPKFKIDSDWNEFVLEDESEL